MKSSPSRVDHTPLRHHRSLDSLNTETRFLDNVSPKRHDQRSIADSKAFVGVIEGMDANARTQNGHRNQLGAFISHSPKGISNSAEELRMKNNSLVQDNGQRGNIFCLYCTSLQKYLHLRTSLHQFRPYVQDTSLRTRSCRHFQ